MSYQVLARKYRPQRFSDVIGQEHVTRTLQNAIAQQRIAHGYIFSGHRGIGKTTVARILAMALNCRSAERPVEEPCGKCDSCTEIRAGGAVDVIEIDAATNRGIDEIRELRDAARYRPARDRYKIYILDEAHQITDAAFNALLKTLEEPPGHVIFMMATTQPEDIPQTIRSRCQHFSFRAVRFEQIVAQLRDIAQQENIKADENALSMLAEAGDGSMRDALSILDQAIACCGDVVTGELVRGLVGAVPSEVLERMMQAVAANSSDSVLREVDQLVTQGHSPVHFARQMVRFLRNSIVAKVAGDESPLLQVSADERARAARTAEMFSEEDLTRFLQIMLRTHSELGYKQEQRFHLELGLLKLVHAQRLLPIEEMLSGEGASKGTTSPAPRAPALGNVGAAPIRPAPPPRPSGPSPFEADRARKSGMPKSEMSSAAATAVAVAEPPPASTGAAPDAAHVRESVLSALESANLHTIAVLLENAEWHVQSNEVLVRVAERQAIVNMANAPDPRRVATTAATEAAGRPVRFRVEADASAQPSNGGNGTNGERSTAAAPRAGGRSRALEDPIVRRMQEKFGAEVRTVIDHRDKAR